MQQNSKIQTTTRVRALSVLFQLADKASLESKKVNAQELQMYMKMLLYLADFEELRILQSLKEFHECDKLSLARSLWLHHRDDIRVNSLLKAVRNMY